MAVDVDKALAPALEVEEGVGRLLHLECGAVYAARQAAVGAPDGFGQRLERNGVVVVGLVVDIVYGPVFEVAHEVAAVAALGEGHSVGYAFEVLYGAAEVYAAHSLDENVEHGILGTCRKHELLLAVAAVELAYKLTVDKHLGVVVRVAHGEESAGGKRRESCAVEDGAEALVVFLHGTYVAVGLGGGEIEKSGANSVNVNAGKAIDFIAAGTRAAWRRRCGGRASCEAASIWACRARLRDGAS